MIIGTCHGPIAEADAGPPSPEAQQLAGLDPGRVCEAVAGDCGPEPSSMSRRHGPHIARAVAAWLCRRHTEAPLRELAGRFGPSRADSVHHLTRRIESRSPDSPGLAEEMRPILQRLATSTAG